jgi:acyl dehydratase
MADEKLAALRARLDEFIGKPVGPAGQTMAPDEVNVPMIRHWVDALDDRDPVYLDEEVAKASGFGGIVAPPAMLQAWTMPRPIIEGIAERGGSPTEMGGENAISVLDDAGYVGTLATNSELEFERYLRPGDRLSSSSLMESISDRKKTSLGLGFFLTWVTTYQDGEGEVVGRQMFRVFKFDPATMGAA